MIGNTILTMSLLSNIWYPINHITKINKPDVLQDKIGMTYYNSEIYKDIVWYNNNNQKIKEVSEEFKDLKKYHYIHNFDIEYNNKYIYNTFNQYKHIVHKHPNCYKIKVPKYDYIYLITSPIDDETCRLFIFSKIKKINKFYEEVLKDYSHDVLGLI